MMNRYHIVASISIFALGLSMPVLAADTAKPSTEPPAAQSGQADTTTGQGQTGQTDAAQSDSSKPKSDKPDTQAGQIESTTGQGQSGQDSPQAGPNTPTAHKPSNAKPQDGQTTSQSGQPDATTGQGQTGQMETAQQQGDSAQSDSAKPKSDQPDAQAGQVESTTGQGQTGQDTPQADANKPKDNQATSQSNTGASGQSPITVQLQPRGDSGVSGTATLTPKGNQTQVVLKLKGNTSNVAQPAHFHTGTCDNLAPQPKYPLKDVVNGESTSVISATVAELTSSPYTLNVHKSAAEMKSSVACGNVKG
jgi:hypothetical protein